MINFTLNGKEVSVDAPDDTPLLWVLRDDMESEHGLEDGELFRRR